MGNAQLKDIDDGDEDFVDELKPGTKLMHGQYVIEKFLNAGGFGITYLAKDSLDRKIVIKECFPGAFCRRSKTIVQARSRAHQPELKSIVRLFVQEARSLSKLTHPNIVGVHQVFEDNDTAYMALDFVEGRDLLDTLEDENHGLNPAQIKSILTDILGAVGFVHQQQMLHRDISPDNILIDENLRPVLIDFGAAREQATKQSRVLSALRVVKDGYSPQEFYIAGSAQDASSDLYALGATFYHLIKGETPPNSQARLAAIASGDKDPYVPLADSMKGYDRDFLAALDMSLQVLPKDRVQSAEEWADMMSGKAPIVAKTKPTAVTATQSEKPKSRMPMLMASVAVVALLGVGVVTQTDLLGTPEANPVVAETETPVSELTETPIATSLTEEPVVVEAAPVVEEALVVEETPVVETPIALAPVVEQAPVVEENAAIENEPAVVETPIVIAEPVVPTPVEEVAITNFAAPAELDIFAGVTEARVEAIIRPELRPADLGVEPLPTPVPTPEIIVDTATTPSLPGFLTSLEDIPFSVTPVLALPEAPADVTAEAIAIALDLPALIPGNEIVEVVALVEVDEPVADLEATETATTESNAFYTLSAWSADIPFTAASTSSNVIDAPAVVAPAWVREGIVVQSVNGTPIESISEIQPLLRETIQLGDASTVDVTFQVEADGIVSSHDWTMNIRQDFQLLNGVTFTAREADGVWATRITSIPEGVETELVVGDELIAYIPTSTKIETRTALKDLLDSEVAAGTTCESARGWPQESCS